MSTYRAVQVASPGKFELVNRPLLDPPAGRVRIRVEACGICHSDSITVDSLVPGITYPRVPGHEVVGRIDAIGEGVTGWKIGQRVGVGYLGGHCGVCTYCRRGDFVNCANQPWSGAHFDGGYAESMIAIPSGLVSIPDGLDAVDAAPLLCAGLTTFNALRRSSAEPDLVSEVVARITFAPPSACNSYFRFPHSRRNLKRLLNRQRRHTCLQRPTKHQTDDRNRPS
jgi:alcohol dehydrogenase, propanol-preferring